EHQPIKFAALEGQFATEAGAPVRLGGLPDAKARRTAGAVEIPKLLSLLAYHDPNATIRGLNEFPSEQWPPLIPVRIAWQLMVGLGTLLAAVGALTLLGRWRRAVWLERPWFLGLVALCAPLGFIAIEAGWV